jgi:hypothetical protein
MESLKHMVFQELSAVGRPLALVAVIEQSLIGLTAAIARRDLLIQKFQSGEIPERARASYYFGLTLVAAEVILTRCAEVKVTHLGEDDGLFGAVDVDPGGSSGDTSDGPKGRRDAVDREAARVLTQHRAAISA